MNSYFDRPWKSGENRATRLVVIGVKGMDQQAITAALRADAPPRHDKWRDRRGGRSGRPQPVTRRYRRAVGRRQRDCRSRPGLRHRKLPTLRLANFLHLQHNLSVDLYLEKTLSLARLIVLRLLGGASYWPYGLEQIEALAKDNEIELVVLPGDSQPDPDLTARSNLSMQDCERLRQYLMAGGPFNAAKFLDYCQHLLEGTEIPTPAEMPPRNGIYRRRTGELMPAGSLLPLACLKAARPHPLMP